MQARTRRRWQEWPAECRLADRPRRQQRGPVAHQLARILAGFLENVRFLGLFRKGSIPAGGNRPNLFADPEISVPSDGRTCGTKKPGFCRRVRPTEPISI